MGDKKSWLLLLVVIIVVAVAGYLVFKMPAANSADANAYQAVFLVNNQVYFGKLANQNAQFPVLSDIYYLQVNQPIQPVQTPKGQTAPAANPEINLVKLGGELHGPTDEMRINRDQILLVEDLRADSNLVKAIENYKNRNAAPVEPAPAQ
jgi:hypothetical protein